MKRNPQPKPAKLISITNTYMTLSIKECLRFGWTTFRANPWIFVGAVLVGLAVELVGSGVQKALEFDGESILSLLELVGVLISLGLSMLYALGHTHFFLRAHSDAKGVMLRDLWYPNRFWRFFGTSILLWVIVGIGILLLIVPGVIAAIVFSFALYLVVDKGLAPVEALKESARLTKGNRWRILLLMLAVVGINLLGLIALFVGLLVTIPVTVLAMVHAYRTLSGGAVAATPVIDAVPAA